MKKISILIMLVGITTLNAFSQTFPTGGQLEKNPWTAHQLMEPAVLAAKIKNPKAVKPLIFNIGVVENIKGAKNFGAASEAENLKHFAEALSKLPKNTPVVVYCGCCPFNKCPNIRPAFNALKQGGFKNGKLLNLATNIKTDWISKGYPLELLKDN